MRSIPTRTEKAVLARLRDGSIWSETATTDFVSDIRRSQSLPASTAMTVFQHLYTTGWIQQESREDAIGTMQWRYVLTDTGKAILNE